MNCFIGSNNHGSTYIYTSYSMLQLYIYIYMLYTHPPIAKYLYLYFVCIYIYTLYIYIERHTLSLSLCIYIYIHTCIRTLYIYIYIRWSIIHIVYLKLCPKDGSWWSTGALSTTPGAPSSLPHASPPRRPRRCRWWRASTTMPWHRFRTTRTRRDRDRGFPINGGTQQWMVYKGKSSFLLGKSTINDD